MSNCGMNLEGVKCLTTSGNLEYLDMSSSFSIFSDLDKSPVPLEDVLSLVSTARVIKMSNCHVTRQTMKKLLKIPWKKKLDELSLRKVDGPICVDLFSKFVKIHLSPYGNINVDFTFDNKEFEERYNQKVIESGEIMPTLGNFILPVKKEAPVIPPPPPPCIKKQTWMDTFHWIFCNCFRKKPLVITGNELHTVVEPLLVKEPVLADEPKLDGDSVLKKKVVYTNENIERQYTSFPYPHMCYIRENADAELWKKLERTCKFFHEKNIYFIIDSIHVESDGNIRLMACYKNIMFENAAEMKKKLCKRLWLTNSLDISGNLLIAPTRNEAKKISLGFGILSMNYFKELTKSVMIKDWNSQLTTIKSEDDEIISLKELLFYLPNVETIRAQVRGINHRNTNEPITLPQNNKIKYLYLQFFDEQIIAETFYDVLVKSLAPKARVELHFTEFMDNEMDVPQFKAEFKTKLDTWKPQIERPTIKIDV